MWKEAKKAENERRKNGERKKRRERDREEDMLEECKIDIREG